MSVDDIFKKAEVEDFLKKSQKNKLGLKKFFQFCESKKFDDELKKRAFISVVNKIDIDNIVEFAVLVKEYYPKIVDVDAVNTRVLRNHKIDICAKLIKSGLCNDKQIASNIRCVYVFGNEKQAYDVIEALNEHKNKNIDEFNFSGPKRYRFLQDIFNLHVVVAKSNNPTLNYNLAGMKPKNFMSIFKLKDMHIEAVINSKNPEYLSMLICHYNTINDKLNENQVKSIVDELVVAKHATVEKYDTLYFIRRCAGNKDENYLRIYDSLNKTASPFYKAKLLTNKHLSMLSNICQANIENAKEIQYNKKLNEFIGSGVVDEKNDFSAIEEKAEKEERVR